MASLKVSARRKSLDIELEMEDGTINKCTMRELMGPQRDAHLTKQAGRLRMGSDGKPSQIRDMAGFQCDLLAMCLYKEDGSLVPADSISTWPASTQQVLFDEAQKMNALIPNTAEAEAKNA